MILLKQLLILLVVVQHFTVSARDHHRHFLLEKLLQGAVILTYFVKLMAEPGCSHLGVFQQGSPIVDDLVVIGPCGVLQDFERLALLESCFEKIRSQIGESYLGVGLHHENFVFQS